MSFASSCLLAILFHATCAEAGDLGRQALPSKMSQTEVETLLLSELSNAFRDGAGHDRIFSLKEELKVLYSAVPKDASGRLGHASVRYMLHRFFAQRNGWVIRGLEPRNDSAISALAPEDITEEEMQNQQKWVPGYLQKFIEEMQGGRDMDLLQLAVLAATLEDIIHKESNQRLQMAFIGLELPFSTLLNETQIRNVLEVYMMIHMLDGDFNLKGREEILASHKAFSAKIPGWGNVQQWMHSLQVEVAPSSTETPLGFTDVSRVVEEVTRNYGKYRDTDCRSLKSALLQMESTKAGRVRLTDFYKEALAGEWEFSETIEYLHALGAVDDSNTSEPYVIVPNYVASRTNCETVSDFYSLCCRNECEGLMATMEKEFQKPMANAEDILERVASLSTQTVNGPRTLAPTLVRRLNSIADANQGQVPLHGRLFAQWMHHAFPRECPYPQLSVDVNPMAKADWVHATGRETAEKTSEELQLIVDGDFSMLPLGEKAREHHNFAENELPWDDTEELLHTAQDSAKDVVTVQAAVPKAPQQSLFDRGMPVFFVLSAAAFGLKLARNTKVSGCRDGSMV